MKMTNRLENFLENLQWTMKSDEKTVQKWSDRFVDDPADALEWSAQTFSVAARHKVNVAMEQFLLDARKRKGSDKEAMEALKTMVTEQAWRLARWVEHSTSMASNLMKEELRAAWVEAATKFQEEEKFKNEEPVKVSRV